jgi:hypothetical protein
MPIYDKPVRQLIPEMAAELAADGRTFKRSDAVAWFRKRYPNIKEATVVAHVIRFCTNAPSRLHYGARQGEDLLFQVDRSRFRYFDPATDPTPIHSQTDIPERGLSTDEDADDEIASEPTEFAYESDLRDFLARNLGVIEPGLELYREDEISGVEFPVGGRFIDILGVDAHGDLVVIELKVSRGYDRVVGQLLRYMAWIHQHHAEDGQSVRGVIVARQITDDLRLAASQARAVSLYEYEMSVSVREVSRSASNT